MPLFGLNTPRLIRDKEELGKVASRFLGFRTIVYRIFPRYPPKISDKLERDPRLTIRFFQHAGLPGATTEREYFRVDSERVDFHLWPEQDFGDQFVTQLVTQLWNATADREEELPQRLDYVHHFACHCDTEPKNSSDYSLLLSHKGGRRAKKWEQSVTIRQIQSAFSRYAVEVPRPLPKEFYPLVFLNACGTSKAIPTALTSFPAELLRTYRGVVGTETPIPDDFAAAFSEKFYSRFVRGCPLGEALQRARWDFLRLSCNPLGILYTVYANPDLCVVERGSNGGT